MKYLILLLSIILIACSPQLDPKGTIAISAEATPEERALILEAVDMWRVATHGYADLTVVSPGPAADLTIRPQDLPPKVAGKLLTDERVIAYDRAEIYTPGQYRTMIAHELGHAFGIDHTSKGSLMHFKLPYSVYPECIDQETVNAFCDIHDCQIITDCPNQNLDYSN